MKSARPAHPTRSAARTTRRVLEEKQPGLLSFGLIAALWGASAAMNSTIKALNRAYDVEETRPFWVKLPLAWSADGPCRPVFFIASFTILILGQAFAEKAGEQLVGLEGASATAFSLLRFPVVFCC